MSKKSPNLQWFRVYASIVDDEKLRLLAFEDRWHFVAICALKCDGLLDDDCDDSLRARKIAVKLGVQLRELDEIKRRLAEVGLIDQSFQPLAWSKRQYRAPDLPEGESLDGYNGYVYFISDSKLASIKIGFSKNPWARLKEFQTGRDERLKVVATVKTTAVSESEVHDAFSQDRTSGEWFKASGKLRSVINEIKAKRLKTADDVVSYANNYVATNSTTTETDTDTEADTETYSLRSYGTRKRVGNPIVILQSVVDPVSAQKWVQHCDEKGKRPSAAQAEELVATLLHVKSLGGNPVEALRTAVRKGWVTVEVEWLRNAGHKLSGAVTPNGRSIDYLAWCTQFFKDGTWGHIGPKPGEPGCKATPDVIERARIAAAVETTA